MNGANGRLSSDCELAEQGESTDLEAMTGTDHGEIFQPTLSADAPSRFSHSQLQMLSTIHKLLRYPPQGSLEVRPTSWLDGVRGGTAVCLFFVLSGYVLTHKSLRWLREGFPEKLQVYPAIASSLFRRGLRLYLPPVLLTFCEMLATRCGVSPPLNFMFIPEPTLLAQFVDWLKEINRFVNPVYNFPGAVQGSAIGMKYDPVVWTLPLEYYGSLLCYMFLFVFVRIEKVWLRMGLLTFFSGSFLLIGSWNLFCFLAGMLIADFHLIQEENDQKPSIQHGVIWTTLFAIAFYVAGLPSLGSPIARMQPMPGFEILHALTPMNLSMEDHSRFWWSISGVLMLLAISQLPRLKKLFETNFCQYMGKIAFSLYLIHEFCLVLFGLSLQSFMMRLEPTAGTFGYWLLCVTEKETMIYI
ncbi:hypothetical protein LAWI1_G007048 [Lachnellula willkommii]|uniref:Acyltransferase 3 domain-containing protein n=1 Tax=Lachnellula willkommii TaxID=215461 RepID=A0A559M014_9HELO|nr:hypothetical protein LAWI1_G007048 [Lachnellula willkommii]